MSVNVRVNTTTNMFYLLYDIRTEFFFKIIAAVKTRSLRKFNPVAYQIIAGIGILALARTSSEILPWSAP